MHYIQKSIKDWKVKFLQESILLYDFNDFKEAFDFTDGFTIQSQSDYNMILDQILCHRWSDNYPYCSTVPLRYH